VSTPAVAVQEEPLAFRFAGALAASWTRFREKHRDIAVSVSASAIAHLAVLIVIGASMYESGEDDRNVPELSVQLLTREGPNSEEYTEAALPKPAPEPAEQVVDDPGTADTTIASNTVAAARPQPEPVPDVVPDEIPQPEAQPQTLEASGAVLTTTGTSGVAVPIVTEPRPEAPVTLVPQPEKAMLTKSMTQLAQKLLDANLTNSELTWSEAGHQYSARVVRQPAPDSTGLEQVIAEIVTDRDGKRMKTRLSMKRLAFSHFTQLVNFWDPAIQLHDDVIDGRFHSNTEIGLAFAGGVEPRFFGKVTTAAASMTYGSSTSRRRNQEIFQGGVETRTERVMLPRDMPDVVNGGDGNERRVFETDTRIIFNADGTYVWRAANGEGALQRADASEHPRYLIGDKGAKLYVSGTVAGIYTVYSPTDIEIENDLVYSKDPRDVVISRDFLALISGRDIKVATAQITGAGDLHVHAAMFAHRRFTIESADRGKPGTLYILGSLTAGTILETEPRYATKMDYDKRFEYLRPASFPMTRRYEVDSWDADWQEVEKPDGAPPPTQGLARSE
jgi:hypothetical protein